MSLRELRSHIASVGRESWLLFIAITVANASNYVFHVVISRSLEPGEYGALGAVLAILILLSVPLGAVQTTVAKRLAQRAEKRGSDEFAAQWGAMLRAIAPVGLIAALVLALASPLLDRFLHLESLFTALLVSVYVMPALVLAVLRGVLQGALRFKELALVSVLPMVLRLAAGIALVGAGGGVPGAVGASVLAEITGIVLAMSLLKKWSFARATERDRSFLAETMPVAAGLGAMWLLIELDVVLARHFLPSGDSGEYAAAGLLARAVLFIPGAVSLVALPHFAHDHGRGDSSFRWLLSSSAIVVAVAIPAAALLSATGDIPVNLTFGSRFSEATSLIPILSFAMVGLGLANLLLFFHVAAGSRIFHLLWPVAGIEAVAITAVHGSNTAIAWVVLVTAWTVAGVGFVTARSVNRARSPLSRLPVDLMVHSRGGRGGEASPDLSLVIPTFNGGTRLVPAVSSMVQVLEGLGQSFEVIVVSDGSTDGCAEEVVQALGTIDVIHYSHREGKGVALRVGMHRAKGRLVAFVDGDGDLAPEELRSFLALVDLYDPDLVIGSKRHPLSTVEYPRSRRVLSWLYQRLVRLLFGLNVRDTQTGMKLVRRDVLDAVLPRMLEKRFAFDLEFLVVARRLGYRKVFEAPVRLDYKFSSTISPRAMLGIALDTAAIFYRRYLLLSYDFPAAQFPDRPEQSAPLAGLVQQGAGP